MAEFAYRPAALRGDRRVVVSDQSLRHGDGPERAWTDSRAVNLQARQVRGVEFVTLILSFAEAREQLAWSGVGSELAAFYGIIREILRAASVVHPDLRVRLGAAGATRVAGFLTGLALAGVGIFLIAIAVVRLTEGDWGVAVVMAPADLVAALAGAAMMMADRPGKRPEMVPVAELIKALEPAPEPVPEK